MTAKPRILFLCTGNSCRSQMAEGWTRHLFPDRFDAYSAGSEPKGLNPLAVQSMMEAGVDISGQRSKAFAELKALGFDLVVTVCDSARDSLSPHARPRRPYGELEGARESCPIYLGHAKQIHHGFEDPAAVEGTEEEKLAVFRRVRDQIKAFVEGLPDLLEQGTSE